MPRQKRRVVTDAFVLGVIDDPSKWNGNGINDTHSSRVKTKVCAFYVINNIKSQPMKTSRPHFENFLFLEICRYPKTLHGSVSLILVQKKKKN